MIIEWQKIRVRPELRDLYLEKDEEIWTAGLAREAGFLGKEVWLGEEDSEVVLSEIVLIIRWRSEEDWKGMPKERMDELDRRFRSALPQGWEVAEMRSYRVVRS
jgi:uncharacterized protein (TIGR03792 family)